ncbi:MAG: NAD(P)H-hydrate epimerase, partial [Methylovulum sp.]|nr:NAD(P)H-hydrate epimerase [Methylovulum sp.]
MHTLPTTLYNTAQIQELEHRVIYQRGVSGFELMTKAGYAVFEYLHEKWRDAKSVVVFCGGGNNGGDGYIVAALARSAGLSVEVYTLVSPQTLKGDALTAYQKYSATHGAPTPFHGGLQANADIVVDALFGTGLDRAVTGDYLAAIGRINQSQAYIVSIDIPSGLNANTGKVMEAAVKANSTVTFIGLKQGLFTGEAAEYCGDIIYAPLAVPADIFQDVRSNVYRVMPKAFPRRDRCMHKTKNGHVLVIGGERGFVGAVMMAAEAALRVGAGLVSVATRQEHTGLMSVHRPELMCHGVDNGEQLTSLLEKATVVVIGPGLGQSHWAKELFLTVIHSRKMAVIDADALNILAKIPAAHNNLLLTPFRSVLTPHVG